MLEKILNRLEYYYKIYVLKDKRMSAHKGWITDKGDETLRLNYDLNADSIIFDIGGYKGKFAESIYNKYGSIIYIFEPVKEFYEIIKHKFENNDQIKVMNYGLSDKNTIMEINVGNDASSVYKDNGKTEMINLVSISTFIEENNIKYIDLLKVNVEGGEYDILPELIKYDFLKNINNLQIQFHDFIGNAEEKRETIRQKLSETHKLTYDYYFIWENWKIIIDK